MTPLLVCAQSYAYGLITHLLGYSLVGSQDVSLTRSNGMTQISLASNSNFQGAGMITIEVVSQSPAAGSVSRPASVLSAISDLGLGTLSGIVDGSLFAVDNVCMTSSSTGSIVDNLNNLLGSVLGIIGR